MLYIRQNIDELMQPWSPQKQAYPVRSATLEAIGLWISLSFDHYNYPHWIQFTIVIREIQKLLFFQIKCVICEWERKGELMRERDIERERNREGNTEKKARERRRLLAIQTTLQDKNCGHLRLGRYFFWYPRLTADIEYGYTELINEAVTPFCLGAC